MRVALSGLTMAEYFRDKEGQDVLLFIDNIFRFTQAGSEVSALLGRMPYAVGYQPTLAKVFILRLIRLNLPAVSFHLIFWERSTIKSHVKFSVYCSVIGNSWILLLLWAWTNFLMKTNCWCSVREKYNGFFHNPLMCPKNLPVFREPMYHYQKPFGDFAKLSKASMMSFLNRRFFLLVQ